MGQHQGENPSQRGQKMSAILANSLEADLEFLMDFAEKNHERYVTADPFPHIALENFLRPEVLDAVLHDFPSPESQPWIAMVDKDQKKFATNITAKLPPSIRQVLFFLNSREIINFLERLTGIEGLIPDPHFAGGGLHELRPGGFRSPGRGRLARPSHDKPTGSPYRWPPPASS